MDKSAPFTFAPATGSTFGAYSPTTCDGTQLQIRNQKDIKGEVRLASTGDRPLNWQSGVYGLHIDRSVGVSLGADLGQGVRRKLYNAPGSSNPTVQGQTRETIVSELLPISALALPGFVVNANYSVAKRNTFGALNLRFGLEGENWNLTAFTVNMLDRKYINEAIPAIEFGGSFISPGARRLIGVEVGYQFLSPYSLSCGRCQVYLQTGQPLRPRRLTLSDRTADCIGLEEIMCPR
ncbi:MAG: hypothetical protein WA793_11770 [Sphingorhabdus sp.]|uniref:hypothetical protein n=1 Tax=Sphingorhabdus sp. TaxID=1902408 RepID=UPI003C9EBC41